MSAGLKLQPEQSESVSQSVKMVGRLLGGDRLPLMSPGVWHSIIDIRTAIHEELLASRLNVVAMASRLKTPDVASEISLVLIMVPEWVCENLCATEISH